MDQLFMLGLWVLQFMSQLKPVWEQYERQMR